MGEESSAIPPHAHPQAYLTSMAQKYRLEGLFYVDLWPVADSMVCLTSPELMNQVTVTKPLPMHKASNDFMAPIVGENVIAAANGPVWKKLAHSMSPAFSSSHIRSLTDLFIDETMLFRGILDDLAKKGKVFSMEETSARLIFDVIARIVFNFPLHAQTKGSKYLDDFHEMIHLVEAQLSFNPLTKLRSFVRRQLMLRRFDASIRTQIQQRFDLLRREKVLPSRREPLSILDLMLLEQVTPTKDGNYPELSSSEMALLVTNVKGLLLGGHGTTTDTLCFIYMLLSKNADVLQQLREEYARVFAPSFAETISILRDSPQKLADLAYTAAVIKETLRLFPVGFNPRQASSQDSTITYNGKTYPIGHDVMVVNSAHVVHYNPEYYEDPDVFRPERWLETSTNAPPDRSLFRTFGRGPRSCMGLNMATDELKVILLMTVRDYDFEMDTGSRYQKPNKEPKMSYTRLDTVYGDVVFQELGLEAKPRGGMMMTVRKVSD